MNIIICGAGEVGSHASEVLAMAGHRVTVIDTDQQRLRAIADTMDVRTLAGNCAWARCSARRTSESADLVVAATAADEVNILTATIAKHMGAARTMARVHGGTFLEQKHFDYQGELGLDQLICPEHLTATAHRPDPPYNPGAMAIERFRPGQIEMQQYAVKP